MPSLTKFAYQALRDIGCLRPGQITSIDVLTDIQDEANQMIEGWQLDGYKIFTTRIDQYNLVGGTQIYTIGPNEVAPNFTAPRPTRIEYANIILNTVSPVVRTPVDVIQDQGWAGIAVQQIPFALPLKLYYDGGYDQTRGYATIYLWPGPLASYQLELFTWQQLVSFADLTTSYNFPPGYARAIRKNLAVSIAPMMEIYSKLAKLSRPRQALLAQVKQDARESMAILESYNSSPKTLPGDPAFMSGDRGGWNYAIGESSR
jgi:hypothetical protein